MRTREPTYSFPRMNSDERLREMILYISVACAQDPTYGATKLNKILQKADFICFARYGTPLTGTEYQALPAGPAPKRLVPVRNRMLDEKEIEEVNVPVAGRTQRRIVARRPPNSSLFAPQALEVVDAVIRELWGKSATDASLESHGRGWRIARKAGVAIPYEAAFLGEDETASADDKDRAQQLARELGWNR